MYKRPVKKNPAPQDGILTQGLRKYLYLTSGIAGGAILMVEILGAKMLSPYFGTSHFVWTAQISITLLALAAGYYLGGKWVDRTQDLNRLFLTFGAAAAYLAVATWLCSPVSQFFLQYKLRVGSVLASAFLFLVPLLLLAMPSPYLVRVMTSGLQGVGGQAGRLSAIGTAGSVLGTILISYVLIPWLPNSIIMWMVSGLLAMLSVVYYLAWGGRKGKGTAAICLLLVAGFGGWASFQETRSPYKSAVQLARYNSPFGLMQVLQLNHPPRRFYLNDFLIQNTYDPISKKSLNQFTYMLHGLARSYTPEIKDALCIGLGIGVVPMQLANEGVRVEVVEINEKVLPMAVQFFDFDPGKMKVHLQDARYILNKTSTRFDTVILDAFLGESSPSHLMTHEAFTRMKKVLKPNGTLVINSFGALGEGRDFLSASLDKTLSSVFKSVRIHGSESGNMFFVASDNPSLEMVHSYDFSTVHQVVREAVREAFDGSLVTLRENGRILRDDYNPVEYFDAANRESLRQRLAEAQRDL